MTLQEKLKVLQEKSSSRIPPEARTIMARATEELRRSGALDRVLKAGAQAPPFTLQDEQGRAVSSRDLLRRGPLVISFYRGMW